MGPRVTLLAVFPPPSIRKCLYHWGKRKTLYVGNRAEQGKATVTAAT